jgi:hypothetical protein
MAPMIISFAVHLKFSRFWPSDDAKPLSNNLVHADTIFLVVCDPSMNEL